MVIILVNAMGTPITLNHVIQPMGSGAQLAAAKGLIEASPVRKIMDTGMDAVNTEKPIFTASSWGILALFTTTAITDIIKKARGQG